MPSPRSLPGQNWLIEFMQRLGYKGALTGVCFGLAMMATQALLLNDIAAFDERLWQMFLAFQEEIPTTTDMLAFIEGIELNQQPWMYAALLGGAEALYQSSVMSAYSRSLMLEERGIETSETFSGVYTKEGLHAYFSTLQDAINAGGEFEHAVTMVLRSHDHTITVAYDTEHHKWLLIESNGKLVSESFDNISGIVNAVHQAFLQSPRVIFSTTLYATLAHKTALANLYSNWTSNPKFKQLHEITSENVNITDCDGASQLAIAVRSEETTRVQQLIAHGANLELSSKSQGTPLMIATTLGNLELMNLLIEAGANLNQGVENGDNALLIAVRTGNLDAVNTLLLAGADYNANRMQKEEPENALFLAVGKGHDQVAEALLKAGADSTIESKKDGIPPMVYAAWKGDIECVRALLRHDADVNAVRKSTGDSALLLAAKLGFVGIATLLIEHGANPLQKNYKGHTPLQIAKHFKHTEIVALINEYLSKNDKQAEPSPSITRSKAGFFHKLFSRKQKASSPSQVSNPR